jgi:hypothetical protein
MGSRSGSANPIAAAAMRCGSQFGEPPYIGTRYPMRPTAVRTKLPADLVDILVARVASRAEAVYIRVARCTVTNTEMTVTFVYRLGEGTGDRHRYALRLCFLPTLCMTFSMHSPDHHHLDRACRPARSLYTHNHIASKTPTVAASTSRRIA